MSLEYFSIKGITQDLGWTFVSHVFCFQSHGYRSCFFETKRSDPEFPKFWGWQCLEVIFNHSNGAAAYSFKALVILKDVRLKRSDHGRMLA